MTFTSLSYYYKKYYNIKETNSSQRSMLSSSLQFGMGQHTDYAPSAWMEASRVERGRRGAVAVVWQGMMSCGVWGELLGQYVNAPSARQGKRSCRHFLKTSNSELVVYFVKTFQINTINNLLGEFSYIKTPFLSLVFISNTSSMMFMEEHCQ